MPAADPQPIVLETAPRQRRSVFGNYAAAEDAGTGGSEIRPSTPGSREMAATEAADLALKRSLVHQFLARAFDYPSPEIWAWLSAATIKDSLVSAVARLDPDPRGPLRTVLDPWIQALEPERFELFHDDYIAAIGHAARGSCPINEIEYGDIKADPLFQPHRLADLAAFYRAFGLEISAASVERHDHLSVELEFMGVLTAQEAHLLNAAAGSDALLVCREAQRKFLREHLGRWTPAFARRLHRAVGEGPLGALACFALAFIEIECHHCETKPGSEDLLLRPVDEAASLCGGCGLSETLPGGSASTNPE